MEIGENSQFKSKSRGKTTSISAANIANQDLAKTQRR
jgi:hypothetical protein